MNRANDRVFEKAAEITAEEGEHQEGGEPGLQPRAEEAQAAEGAGDDEESMLGDEVDEEAASGRQAARKREEDEIAVAPDEVAAPPPKRTPASAGSAGTHRAPSKGW